MKIELDDGEVNTILVALKNYQDQKELDWLDSRADPDAPDMGDEELLDAAGSSEWCWQKIFGAIAIERNATADAVGEGEQTEIPQRNEQPQLPFNTQTNSGGSASVDPFDLGMTSQYDNMGDE